MPDIAYKEFTDRFGAPFKVTSFTFNGADGIQHTNAFVLTDGDGNRVGLAATSPMFLRLTDGTNAYDARQIRALSQASDTVGAVQSGAWSVSVSNFPSVQAVSQSGTWNVNTGGLTDVQLRAAAVPVSVAGVATEATLSALNGKFNTLGTKTAANSVPVALASDQATIANPLAVTWSIGGAAASATNPAPVQLSLGNTAVNTTNPIPTREVTDEATTYFTAFTVVPTLATAGTRFLVIRNVGTGLKKIRIEKLEAILYFVGTAANTRSQYFVRKYTAVSATTGTTTLTPEKGVTSAPTSVADIKVAPGGLGLTGAVAGQPVVALGHANQLSANIVYDRDFVDAPIVLDTNECLVLEADGAIVLGSTLSVGLRWMEVA